MQKRSLRRTSGAITTYTHANGSIGVLLEVTCESDFIARSEDFKQLTHDVALQIAAMNPKFIRKEDVPTDGAEQYPLTDVCLYEQPFIKDNSLTVEQLIIGYVARLREDIAVTRFVRFSVGDPASTIACAKDSQQPGDEDSSGVIARLPKRPKAGSGAAHADLDEGGSQ